MTTCNSYLLVVSAICIIFSFCVGFIIGRNIEKKRSIEQRSIEQRSIEKKSTNGDTNRERQYGDFNDFSEEISPPECTPNNPCHCCENVKVYFLPDSSAPSPFYVNKSGNQRCFQANRRSDLHGFPYEPESALMEIMATMAQAKKSIYVCVYLLTLWEIRDILISRRNNRVVVRMITDSNSNEEYKLENQTQKLKNANIQVKTNASAMMHNKFVIVDGQIAILGSTNLTRKAFFSNDEALIMTRQPVIVEAFTKKFDSMWGEMSDYKRPDVRINMDTTNHHQQLQR